MADIASWDDANWEDHRRRQHREFLGRCPCGKSSRLSSNSERSPSTSPSAAGSAGCPYFRVTPSEQIATDERGPAPRRNVHLPRASTSMKISGKSSKPAKPQKTTFFCTACGNEQPRWFGHCPACGEWNTASEAPAGGAPGRRRAPPGRGALGARGRARRARRRGAAAPTSSDRVTTERRARACASSIACWAAASCPARCCWWAAIPASARARCCCSSRAALARDGRACST